MEIKVCTGNTCSEKFSKYIITRIENDIRYCKLKNIKIESSPCMGQCKKGPSLKIDTEFYNYITPVKASELINKKPGGERSKKTYSKKKK